MTTVTTSRKPESEVRALAKDLAFAGECRYMVRGKMGMKEVGEQDPLFLIVFRERGEMRIQAFDQGVPSGEIIATSVTVSHREDDFRKGIFTTNQSIYELLKSYVPVTLSKGGKDTLSFDGTRRTRYHLTAVIHAA
jgi:U3 small nucleolar ribonucleoprotein protein IMP4